MWHIYTYIHYLTSCFFSKRRILLSSEEPVDFNILDTPPQYQPLTPQSLTPPSSPIPEYDPASPVPSNWSTYYEHHIPAPRVLNPLRLFFPYTGWVDVGYNPSSDGYGNADVEILTVIQYKNYWLSLNETDLFANKKKLRILMDSILNSVRVMAVCSTLLNLL